MGFALPEGWVFYSEEEMAQVNGFAVDSMGTEYQEMANNATLFYAAFATDPVTMDNININLEKAGNVTRQSFDAQQNVENIQDMVAQGMESMGTTVVDYGTDSVYIDGKVFYCIYMDSVINGVQLYQYTIQVGCDGYVASICITAHEESSLETLLEYFYLT